MTTNTETFALNRSTPPTTVIRRRFQLPPFQRSTEGALEVVVLRRPSLPIVSMSLIGPRAGGAYQPLEQAGLASLAASSLTEGTKTSVAVEFAERAEALGGFVSSGADWDAGAVHAGSLSKHFEETLELVVEAYFDAAFRAEDVGRLQTRLLAEIARRASDPSSIAGKELIHRLYGQTPYGTSLIGSRASVEALDSDTLRSFWNLRSQERASLVVAGDVDPEEVGRQVAARLTQLTEASEASSPPEYPSIEPRKPGVSVHLIDRPKGAQTQLMMGHPGPGRTHPDRAKLRLLNAIFGGKFSSRINLNLREEHGYTYGANSSFSARRGPGPFAIQSAVENDSVGDACRQVLHEIERIRTDPVASEELESSRSYLLGVQPYGFQTIEGWVSALGALTVYDLSNSFYDEQQQALAEVTAADLLEAANTHLQPDQLTIVAVGPTAQLERQFEGFDSVSIESVQNG